uniref:Uncharacterized protein LOC100368198 n=1 Tax=Saccoglossus kowalevskii TaxID=10224 RepID=A0ABM0GW60_SACKO|nr:PREDICTED: uncharacterized protein LOC100368198 [Saccoglossus kowalevskii]
MFEWLCWLIVLQQAYAADEACDVWTDWMDDENGGLVDFEAVGEFELIEDLRLNYQICDSPSEIECRTAVEPYTPWDQTSQTLQCHLSFGLICFHDDNYNLCQNYEVRVFCPCDIQKGGYNDSAADEFCVEDDLFKVFLSPFLSWKSADDYCRDLYSVDGFEASLAIVEKKVFRNTLRTFLMKTEPFNNPPRHGYWIGCHDREIEGTFMWTNGEDFSLSSEMWQSKNPNNRIIKNCDDVGHDQDCCQLWESPRTNPQFKLDDECCTKRKPFICHIRGRCAM